MKVGKNIMFISFIIIITIIFSLFYLGQPISSTVISPKQPEQNIVTKFEKEITIDSVFQDDHSWIATLSADRVRTIIATGDVIPSRSVNFNVIKYNNPLWPYEKIISDFNKIPSDITFINLETPLFEECRPTVDGMIFCGHAKNIDGLKTIGVDIASLANNHAGNYGQNGVDKTIQLLKEANITPTGINGPVYKDIRGIKFAFLGYNDIDIRQEFLSWAQDERIKKEIREAKQNADVVIVTYHFGIEYRSQPDERQKYLAHFAVDSGADVVIGNHPHWIQPIELYKGKFITYAHGNFIFDQMWSEETKKGVIGIYKFYDDKLIDVQFLPLYIADFGQASFVDGKGKEDTLNNMKQQSIILVNHSLQE